MIKTDPEIGREAVPSMLSKQNFQVKKEHESAARSAGEGAVLSTAADPLHPRDLQLPSRKSLSCQSILLGHLAWPGERICRYLPGRFKVISLWLRASIR
jgi:hypothetical protein